MLKKVEPYRVIASGFIISIIIGGILLWLPISHKNDVAVSLVDAFFTTISCICVTGLSTIDAANTFNLFGVTVMAILIQIGGLGIICAGLSIILLAGQKIGIKERVLIKDSLNLNSLKGIVKLVLTIFKVTFIIELIGAILSFLVFKNYYELWDALVISVFHSISAFNNAGFDLIGNFQNLLMFKDNILLNVTTALLIIIGGLGFLVIKDFLEKKDFKHLTLHSKIVIKTTLILIIAGTLLLKVSQNISWLGAFFMSVSTRTAGFNTVPMESFNKFGLTIMMVFMFIGASPSSTGGGIKTTTFYTLIKGTYSVCTNKRCHAFKRHISDEIINRAFIVLFLGLIIVCLSTLSLCTIESDINFIDLMFESVSAFGTVGLSTGITSTLKVGSKITIMIVMFFGRVGPLTLLSVWSKKGKKHVNYPEENILIG
ncbi:MAG: potassium transporter TrkG [Bacilli bacterium]